ncbi:MAG: acyl-CoA synthetase [Solirubrobacteraceae bacterium]|nr:acyl-CoA synthetase [Solirubrobacteraceae bacterium]
MYPGAHDPNRLAIVMDDGETRTFGELDAAAARIARMLQDRGLQRGDHVAFCVENEPEFLEICWGAHYAGLLYTACSTRLTADELAYIVDNCGAKAFFLGGTLADRAAEVDAKTPNVDHRFSVGGDISGYEPLTVALEGISAEPLTDPIAGADMLYSSGTTGRPKGIKPKPKNEPLNTMMMFTGVLAQALGFGDGDVYLSPAPLYHAAPLRGCMSVHQLGGTTVVMRKFDPQQFLDLVAEHGITHSQMVPTMFVRLLKLSAEARAAADVSSLKGIVHAAAPCPVDVKRQMIEWWGPIIHEYYASTEGAGLTWTTSEDWLAHPGTVGRAVVGKPRVVDALGTEVGPGEEGTIYFSDGPEFEYHEDPAKTAEVHNEQGWATAGDIGYLDEEGFLFLTDRKAHMIITGGVNVYPQEAENALVTHPKVSDAAVFGIPNEDFGEEVKAVVVPMEEPADPAALEAELIAHCRSKLADLKCPRSIDFRTELPRHETGKLYKRLLVDEYRAAHAADPS